MIGETKNRKVSKTFLIPAMRKNLGTGVNGDPRHLAQGEVSIFCAQNFHLQFLSFSERAEEEWRRGYEAVTIRGRTRA